MDPMTQPQETEMKQKEQNAPRDTREEDLIVLGTASIETAGKPGITEFDGVLPMGGITE